MDVVTALIARSENWVSATLPLDTFCRRKWPKDFPNLELLTLVGKSWGSLDAPPTTPLPWPAKLRELELTAVQPAWIERFVGPSLRSLKYKIDYVAEVRGDAPILGTLDQLSKLPNLQELEIVDDIRYHLPFPSEILQLQTRSCVPLPYLERIHLSGREYPALLLEAQAIRAPSLRTLFIKGSYVLREPSISLTLGFRALFRRWSTDKTGQFIPVHLHTLQLEDCLSPGDIPNLVHLLSRLPALVRLTVANIEVRGPDHWQRSADSQLVPTNAHMILEGLSKPFVSPDSSEQADRVASDVCLCPRLLLLDLSASDVQTQDLIELAQVRGVRSGLHQRYTGATKSLRTLRGPLCADGLPKARTILKALVDSFECGCLSCAMDLAMG
jgi:hypothetical protein